MWSGSAGLIANTEREINMSDTNAGTEPVEGCDPRFARGRCGPGYRKGHGRHRWGWGGFWPWFKHGWHRHEGCGPSGHQDREACDFPDFNEFGEGGFEMPGDERGRHGGHRHMWGRKGGGFGWPFGGMLGHGPGQPSRPLEQGDLRWLILDLLAAQPRHGYEVIKAIGDAMNGHYSPSPGVVYPTLTLLEETGLIAGEAQGSKKLYRLTDEGRAEIQAHASEIRAARGRLDEAKARFGGSPAPELMRAMHNLRAALQVRLAKGELSAEALRAITAAIDQAASEIERS